MKKKELIKALFIGTLSLSSLVGCKKTVSEEPEKKQEKKQVEEEKEDTTVYEITVEDVVNNSSYQNKYVKVKGYIPNELYYDEDGNMIVRLYNEEETEYVVVTGEFPTSFFCLVWVSGQVVEESGKTVLKASAYELIEQYYEEVEEYEPSLNYGACVYGPPEAFD